MSDIINHCLVETYKHTCAVRKYLNLFIKKIIDRSEVHDDSKFEEPELSGFAEFTDKLGQIEYGSPEYAEQLRILRPTLEHHYSKNRHHAEFHKNGINDMTLVDLIELLSDWGAATERMANGNIRKSIDINAQRYNISPQLKQILENTVKEYF